jgi:peptidoglycan/LPS O-acetylase OafA/YrhL
MTSAGAAKSLRQIDFPLVAQKSHPVRNIQKFPEYRPEVDGLRAIAVLMVILCHAQLQYFTGGFVGVDVFFTISGYVVALAIFRDQKQGDFTLINFYGKRLRRLAPSLYLVLSVTIIFCFIFCFPQDTFSVLKNSLLVAVFSSNIYLAKQTGYFDVGADKQPLLHTWSLSVEEQFYLIFPLLLLSLRRARVAIVLFILCTIFATSLAWSQHAVTTEILQSYYKLQYRIFEFALGTIIAVMHHGAIRQLWHWLLYDLMLVLGIALICYTCVTFNALTSIPGWHALLPCVGAALIIAGGRNARFSGYILNNSVAVYVGRLSYVLYLWHWPVMFALRRLQLNSAGWMLFSIVLSVLFAVLTHHFLEQPLRRVRWGNKKSFAILLAAPVLLMAAMTFAAKNSDNFIKFYPENYRINYEDTGHSVFDTERSKKCWSKTVLTDSSDCNVGDTQIPINAVFWGDSHAYHQIEFINQVGRNYGLHIHDLTFTMCPPHEDGPARAGDSLYQSYRDSCLIHNRNVMAYILSSQKIKTVVMSAVWQNYQNSNTGASVKPSTHGYRPGDDYLGLTLEKLTAAGKNVILLDDIPSAPLGLENCPSNRIYLPNNRVEDCTYDAKYAQTQYEGTAKIIGQVERRFPSVKTIHTADVPCSNGRCDTELLNVPMYRNNDNGHMGAGGTRIYYQAYLRKHPTELQDIFSNILK